MRGRSRGPPAPRTQPRRGPGSGLGTRPGPGTLSLQSSVWKAGPGSRAPAGPKVSQVPGARHMGRSQHPQPPPVVPPTSLPRGPLSTSHAALGPSPDSAGLKGTLMPLDPRSAQMGPEASRSTREMDLG